MTIRIRAALAFLLASACMAATPASKAASIVLNDTGMTECVDHHGGLSTDCAKSGQDAAEGRDATDAYPDDGAAGFSFRKVCVSGQKAGEGTCPADPKLGAGLDNWGCTYDNITGLTWETKTSDGGRHDGRRTTTYRNKDDSNFDDYNWDAMALIDATNMEARCGATNWRLPELLEFHSIVHYGRGVIGADGPFIDPTFFPNTRFTPSWTSTRSADNPKAAWTVSLLDGSTREIKGAKSNFASPRLVHDMVGSLSKPQAARAADRFIPSPDGTEVSDTMTGLVWRRCAAGMAWNNVAQTCDGTATRFRWKVALDYAKDNVEGGWRLPNVKELLSIIDTGTQDPAIVQWAFPNTPTDRAFLSSTMSATRKGMYGAVVSFSRGEVLQQGAYEFRSWPLRLVRSPGD
jgi:hypothetical protein